MKKLTIYLFAIFAIAACTEGNPEDGPNNNKPSPQPQPEKSEISLDTTSANFTMEGGEKKILFSTNEAWTAEIVNDRADGWLSVTPTSGSEGNATLTITAGPNDTPDERTASVRIKAGTAQKTINVSQKQKDALTVTSSKFEVGAEGGEVKIEVKANIDFEYAIDESAQEWIKYEGTRAMKISTLTFYVAENDDTEKREGKIYIQSGEFNEEVTIYQAGAEPSIVISQNEYVVAADGETIAIDVTSNVDVTVELPANVDWISENTTRATSTNTYYFDIQPNEDYDQRSAEIKFTNTENGLSEIVKVVQTQKDALVVAKDSYTVSSEGDQIEIEVGHNVDFDIEIANDWITKADTRAFVTENIVFNIAKNTSYDNREGTIIFKSKDGALTQTVKVYQAQADALIISKKDIVVSDKGGTISFELQTNVEFNVSDPDVNWLRPVTTRGLTTHTLNYTVDANTSYDFREARIVVTDTKNNKSETITITQIQKDAIVLAKSEYELDYEGGEISIEVGHNVDFDVEIDSDWITEVTTRAYVTETLTYNIAENTTDSDREGSIIFTSKDGNLSQTIIIKQQAFLFFKDTEHLLGGWGGRVYLYPLSDTEFDIEIMNEWISFEEQTTNHIAFSVETYPNYTHSRTGTILATSKDKKIKQEIRIIQNPLSDVSLGQSIYQFGINGGYLRLDVSTNANISVTISENARSWIHQIHTRTTDMTLNFEISECSSDENREGYIFVEGGECRLTVTVLQNSNNIPNNEIWYTTSNNTVAEPNKKDVFGASIISNVYENGLGRIVFDGDVDKIESFAFTHSNITSITIPHSVKYIGDRAIMACNSLSRINNLHSNITFKAEPFFDCRVIESFSGELASKDNRCIIKNDTLITFAPYGKTKYNIQEGVMSISNSAFYLNQEIVCIYIPRSLQHVGYDAFGCCVNLTKFEGYHTSNDNRCIIIDNVLLAFAPNEIHHYTIPNNVSTIGVTAFSHCYDLNTITIPISVEKISRGAFSYCDGLESIVIPNSVTEIGSSAFIACRNLKSAILSDGLKTIKDYCFSICSSLTKVVLPTSLLHIEHHAFSGCFDLSEISIPASVVNIGANAFDDCRELQTIYCHCTTPPQIYNTTFRNTHKDLKIYVPTESVDLYKSAEGWKDYADKIFAEPTEN